MIFGMISVLLTLLFWCFIFWGWMCLYEALLDWYAEHGSEVVHFTATFASLVVMVYLCIFTKAMTIFNVTELQRMLVP